MVQFASYFSSYKRALLCHPRWNLYGTKYIIKVVGNSGMFCLTTVAVIVSLVTLTFDETLAINQCMTLLIVEGDTPSILWASPTSTPPSPIRTSNHASIWSLCKAERTRKPTPFLTWAVRILSVRKTIWDLEFSERLLFNFLLACLS